MEPMEEALEKRPLCSLYCQSLHMKLDAFDVFMVILVSLKPLCSFYSQSYAHETRRSSVPKPLCSLYCQSFAHET